MKTEIILAVELVPVFALRGGRVNGEGRGLGFEGRVASAGARERGVRSVGG